MARQARLTRRLLTALAAASLLTTMGITALPASAAPGSSGGGNSTPAGAAPTASPGSLAKSIDLSKAPTAPAAEKKLALHGDGVQTVFVQLKATAGPAVSAKTLATAKGTQVEKEEAARKAVLASRATIAARATTLTRLALGSKTATPMYTVSNAVPGFLVRATPAQLAKIAGQSDVVKISAIVPKHPDNAYPAQLTKVLNTWQDLGILGEDVKVGVIDTGLDYTHADFGGPGTEQAYQDALKNSDSLLSNWQSTLTALGKAKVGGGYDFAGNTYNADPKSASYQPIPRPDPDPLDCNEHGTHVAGTVAGYGLNNDGSVFTGDYSDLTATDLNNMRIGPGMAPEATLYSFKVFGCDGSTDVVIPALDAALDPNGDGDYSDRMDIVNLSLGSDYATPDDPENAVVDALAQNGVLPVIAMGNGGDLTDIGGSPGNAVRSLAVASSVDAYQLLSGINVNEPPALDGVATGQVSVNYDWAHMSDITADVVPMSDSTNQDGCKAYNPADTTAVAGKIVWLTWDSDDSTRKCGSGPRAGYAAAAGAVGVILTGDVPVFGAGIAGSAAIPVFQLTLTETQRLQAAAAAGTLNVTMTASLVNNQPSIDDSLNDLVSSFSSRGTRGSIGVVKPDVTAPGDTIVSAGMGTGNDVLSISGTSMATPHTAGIAALVKAAHPHWTTEQLKAAIMNSADHNLYSGPGQTGDIYGPNRVGAGRVDALDAVTTSVLAYSSDVTGAVSASFGIVEAPAGQTTTLTRHVTVSNTGDAGVDLTLGYSPAIETPGVSYAVSPASLHLDAGSQQDVTVTLTAVADDLRHTIDPTMAVDQSANALPRQFVTDASGWMTVSQSGKDDLRVPVYGAVKPVSSLSVAPGAVDGGTALTLSGTGFDQGDPSDPSAWTSIVSVMQFGAESPQLPDCPGGTGVGCTMNQTAKAGDIQYVGAGISPNSSGSLKNGWLWFGISTYADWATIGNSTVPYVDFDVNGDGHPDYEVYAQNISGTDVLVAWLYDIHAGAAIDFEPINMNFGDVDTNVFDSNVVLLPVWPKLVGITDSTTSFPITYWVGTNSAYTGNPSGDIDEVGPVSFDAGAPKVAVDSPLWIDADGDAVPVTVADKFTKTLVFHLHNADGARAQTVLLSPFNGFSDLPDTNIFYNDIAWLVASGIGNGYPDGTFRIGQALTRAQLSGFLYRYLNPGMPDAACTGATRTFTDVPASNTFCGDIEWLAAQGIISPASGQFRPADNATREEMATFLYRTLTGGGPDLTCSGTTRTFTDVPASNPNCGNIEWLADKEIVKGTGGGLFSPTNPLTRGQMAAFLHRGWLYEQSA